ncbi:MAG: hypothetical protein ACKVZ0_24975 [Gemmatimonadales bacterium]
MKRVSALVLGLVMLALTSNGCFILDNSPTQFGLDIRIAPGFALGSSDKVTIHPTAAYARGVFGGVDGESDNILHFGGQVRAKLSSCSAKPRCPWFGGEATFARRRTTFDNSTDAAESTNGFTLAGLAGVPLVSGKAGTIHGVVAGGMVKFGGSGPYVRIGFDFQPAFLRR